MRIGRRLVARRYLVGELLGRGGMSDVHRGTDTRLGRTVAIKFLKPSLAADPASRQRFRLEAHAASRMTHPSVVRVFDAGEETVTDAHGRALLLPYIVMEYVAGTLLRDTLRSGPLAVAEAAGIADGILTALDYSHRAGVVHRDIKPGNVMITHGGQVKVMDFGIARAAGPAQWRITSTAILGTAGYFSPEQAQGLQVDARSDLYSTGVVLFEMLTGRPPFLGADAAEVARQHICAPPPVPSTLNPAVPPAVDTVVERALAKDRAARYASAQEFRTALARALGADTAVAGGHPAVAAPYANPQHGADRPAAKAESTPAGTAQNGRTAAAGHRPQTGRPRTAWLWTVVAAVAVAALLVGTALWYPRRPRAVPDLAGMSYQAAAHELAGRHLAAHRAGTASATVPEGRVVATRPRAGTDLTPGSTVTLSVSTGPAARAVPDVHSMQVAAAQDALTAAGFTPGAVDERDSAQAPGGTVLRTVPAAGSIAEHAAVVDLIVSSGTVYLPDLTGQALSAAVARLSAPDLALAAHTRADPGCPTDNPATVAAQSLPSGEVPQHAGVTLSYCTG